MNDIVEEIEKQYPETCKEFKRLQAAQYEIFCKKQFDYGPGNVSLGMDLTDDDSRNFASTAIIIRINDKVQRLINLVVRRKTKPQNEPVEDAFKDLSVYGLIAQIVNNGKWGK